MDSIFWASITTPNNDYYKFTFELDTNVHGITNDTTPSFVFTTSESGTLTTNITEGFSTNLSVAAGSNQIATFNTLDYDNYSGKTITVTDLAGNTASLNIPIFTIESIWTSTFGLTGSNIPSNNKKTIKIKLVSANRYLDVGTQNFGPNYVAGTQYGHYEFIAYETSYINHLFTVKYDNTDANYPWKIFWNNAGENSTAYLVSYIYNPNGIAINSDPYFYNNINNYNYSYTDPNPGNNVRTNLRLEKSNGKYAIKTKAGFYLNTTTLLYTGAPYGGWFMLYSDQPKYIWDIEFQ